MFYLVILQVFCAFELSHLFGLSIHFAVIRHQNWFLPVTKDLPLWFIFYLVIWNIYLPAWAMITTIEYAKFNKHGRQNILKFYNFTTLVKHGRFGTSNAVQEWFREFPNYLRCKNLGNVMKITNFVGDSLALMLYSSI